MVVGNPVIEATKLNIVVLGKQMLMGSKVFSYLIQQTRSENRAVIKGLNLMVSRAWYCDKIWTADSAHDFDLLKYILIFRISLLFYFLGVQYE